MVTKPKIYGQTIKDLLIFTRCCKVTVSYFRSFTTSPERCFMTTHIMMSSFAVLLLCLGCSDNPGYNCRCKNLTNYEVNANTTTPNGIEIDTSGFNLDLDAIDHATNDLEICLKLSIDNNGFNIKVAPDWFVPTEKPDAQAFPCDLPSSQCGNKPVCVCYGVVQPLRTVVITPNLAAYRHELIHLVTNTGHDNPQFELCE